MGIELTITWIGRTPADFARVFDAAANIKDFSPVLKEIGSEVIAPSVEANFATGGRPKWAPLSPVTVARKSAAGAADPSKILVHTGAMRKSASDHERYSVTPDKIVAYPLKTPYWQYHQQGGPKLPQRVIMMLQVEDRTRINRLFADYIRSHMVFDPRAAGGRQFTGGGIGLAT